MNVVILAAGQGRRMNSALPKVLHPLAGKPLLGHVLDTARALGAVRICVVYGHGGDQVQAALNAPDLLWVSQSPQLGTGHAVLQALPQLATATPSLTLVLYGDVPLIQTSTLQRLLDVAVQGAQGTHSTQGAKGTKSAQGALALLTANLDNPQGYGRIVREAGKVTCIVEEKDASDAQRQIHEINTGMLVAPTEALSRWLPTLGNRNAQGEYYLTDIVAMAVHEGLPVVTAQPDVVREIEGVNSKVQLAALERVYQRTVAESLLNAGVSLVDPARIDVRGQLTCGRDVFIDVNNVFEGQVTLADNVRIGANCVLKNCRIAQGASIAPFCHIEDANVGPNCRIGPYARLRPGTDLGGDVHIGNFVEVKNSAIADHSKANHLAYIGDATIGQRVNVGAGTITCNYDGANKFRTVIEDDVFIGSDTQLVAPVTVGRGATLGAGTTLTKNAPPGQLTISRAKQLSIAGWKRPAKQKKD
ncbi:bifunctional N-acetylglucosamine-1-phosphate uridyltransferase/glucosamine-1-phosphate acetyltransferase [Rugosibacter aromaticivorans]|uniref:Bifunctional protein GlmU n=1 Tax=Rugosibacter aromaticivorans TaxID=1565605 RepID=A0A0C5JR23_9PROT|nr:bifunctional UDP-N-acetylglucosamine diphosphorylase/glucosamine-1-phosphate N-acetyltransferase GlmU [Rugosibacter aromaticivorans]AJP49666.1 bifunctional N-acetylglucosamine-1-phosphate uridyltransferase/glucosamine-1-phosphate acetyltransferase [Rugosibacter aromaticivorans]TBR15791.1 MAG: UDP-N-acetylglucosamine diphosphorylase/glucosamine-1-phosphate N-acetyltransferase [Rugosibacter sp.]